MVACKFKPISTVFQLSIQIYIQGDNTIIITLRQTSTSGNKSKKSCRYTQIIVEIPVRIKWGKPGKEDALILNTKSYLFTIIHGNGCPGVCM